jgi:NADH:ubiquinone reductase (non-electrogenic)
VEAPDSWPFAKNERNKIVTDATLRVGGHARVFAVGDVASTAGEATIAAAAAASAGVAMAPAAPLASTAQVAFQQADYAAWNLWVGPTLDALLQSAMFRLHFHNGDRAPRQLLGEH